MPKAFEVSKLNMNSKLKRFLILFVLTVLSQSTLLSADTSKREIELLFLRKIKPLLKHKCFGCHGDDPKKIKADYNMHTREGMLKGGDSEYPAIFPGEAHKSPIMEMIKRNEDEYEAMPPKEAEKLTAAQIGWIESWINAGAPWPDERLLDDDPNFIKVETSGAQSQDWADRRYNIEDLWAYRPIINHPVPAADQKHPIDNFIAQKLLDDKKASALLPAGKASRKELVRRVTLSLTGLNPSFEEVQKFINDQSPKAYENLIDRLLASKHYGERMGRMWLDVTRYADTSGYSNDYERPNAWRYRDYVIRSFNQDKPYDLFTMEQIAGDELAPEDPDSMIATSFLRMGAWEHTGMSVKEITRQLFLDDVTEAVGKTFLAQPLGCAKCHDHKFDPIPTKDYYRILAVFATTQFAHRSVPFTEEENVNGRDMVVKLADDKIAHNNEFLKRLLASDDVISKEQRYKGFVKKQGNYFAREKMRFDPYIMGVYNGPNKTFDSSKLLVHMPKHLKPLNSGIDAAIAFTKKKQQHKFKAPDTFILTGGSIESPAARVTPGVLSAMDNLSITKMASFEREDQSRKSHLFGRRLAFAKWVTSKKNSMTSRVIVNRIWQMHFAKGIVKTPSSFGVNSAKPTHPKLLDYLATWFMENGWSIKRLHKHILTSDVYQRATEHSQREKIDAIDPDNKLLLYFPAKRLEAEMIYDSLLKMTGELNPEMGGPGVFPEINWEVALQNRKIMGGIQPVYVPSPQRSRRHRRQIYAFIRRSALDPMLEVFNKPGSELSCARRDETTVTPQVFALFNSEFSHNRALALANRIVKAHQHMDERVDAVFKAVYGRSPSPKERALALDHVKQLRRHHEKKTPKQHQLPLVHTSTLVDEATGLSIYWEQLVASVKYYERDLMPWQVDASTRALSELCLVLINSNEFLYVY